MLNILDDFSRIWTASARFLSSQVRSYKEFKKRALLDFIFSAVSSAVDLINSIIHIPLFLNMKFDLLYKRTLYWNPCLIIYIKRVKSNM